MGKQYTQSELMKQALKLGALTHRVYHTERKQGAYLDNVIREEFSYHFFDKHDEEVCYFILDTYESLGLVTLEIPRVWSDSFKQNPLYSKPIKIEL